MEKLALVTGASRGYGVALVKALEARGCTVIRAVRDFESWPERADVPEALTLEMDVSDPTSVQAAARTYLQRNERLDILINNAGIILDEFTTLENLEEDVLRETLETNLLGAFRVTNAFLPALKKSGSARVINVSSRAGQLTTMTNVKSAYSISKTALNALTVQQAYNYQAYGISVNAMCPGWLRTDMGGPYARYSAEEGTDTAIWLALDVDSSITGRYWRQRTELAW